MIKSNNLEKGLEEQKAVDVWEKVVGCKINENTDPLSVENGVLSVKTRALVEPRASVTKTSNS